MSEPGFILHPEAAQDITEIWEYIVRDSPQAARRVRETVLEVIRSLVPFPIRDTVARTSPAARCVLFARGIT